MNKIVVTLLGLDGTSAGRINVHLQDLPEGYCIFPEAIVHELDVPTFVRGIQLNAVTTAVLQRNSEKTEETNG